MNKLKTTKRSLVALILCLSVLFCGCGNNNQQNESEESSPSKSQQSEEPSSSKSQQSEELSSSKSQQSEELSSSKSQQSEELSEVIVDYGDAKSFEAELNEGKNLEGKVVQFVVEEFHPESKLGYNIWAGEHLNFVSSRNPDVKEGDTVTAKITTIENIMGSWVINYEKIDNAVVNEDTISFEKQKETTTEKENDASNENNYEHNDYYDIVETSSFQNSIGYTIVVHKVLAKKNVSVSSTMLAYAEDGNVIGKSTDDITLTEGQYNFFRYSFEEDISNAKIQTNFKTEKDSFMIGERNAVEMVQYNQSDDNLYITLKQTGDEIGSFAKFKLLFYSEDKIVDAEDGYFDVYAENLSGKGTTDVAEIWVYGIKFDRVEFIYEP